MQHTLSPTPVVWIVEDHTAVADAVGAVCESQGWSFETFRSAETFISSDFRSKMGCLVLDLNLPGPITNLRRQMQRTCHGSRQ